ncbi:MAG: GHKL domain-containing protein [Treponema sp.]|uniref:sensor histidine kinase n=1 Tax=Treponema sp. TaxID=166 RepID=UPI00298E064B|nr:GHKL domain-containing protein [Treponema sp.]MCQ2601718.1 GHKL domain-containing protein [Treponema sp.]
MLSITISVILSFLLEYIFFNLFILIHNYEKKIKTPLMILLFSVFDFLTNFHRINEFIGIRYDSLIFRSIFLGFFSFRMIMYPLIFQKINKKILFTSFSFYIIDQIFNTTVNFFLHSLLSGTTITCLSLILEIILFKIFIFIVNKKNMKDSVQKTFLSVKPASYFLIMIFAFFYILFLAASIDNIRNVIIFFGSGTILIIPFMIYLIFRISVKSKQHEEMSVLLEKQLENQAEYYEKINQIYSELRSFRHDYKNHIMCVKNLLSGNNISDAIEYLNDISNVTDNKDQYYDTGNTMINALLTEKNKNAALSGTRIIFSGMIPPYGIKNSDLCTIFANALDNAVEACEKDTLEQNKIISIDSRYNQGYYFITISNPFFENIIKDNSGKITTSKKDKEYHGFGVSNIKNTVKKYKGNTSIDISENIFKINIDMLLTPKEKSNI